MHVLVFRVPKEAKCVMHAKHGGLEAFDGGWQRLASLFLCSLLRFSSLHLRFLRSNLSRTRASLPRLTLKPRLKQPP